MSGRGYALKKVGQAIFTMVFVVSFNFFLFRVMPSDPVAILTRIEGKQLSDTERQAKIAELGLDKPLLPQFFDYLGDLAVFDLGTR